MKFLFLWMVVDMTGVHKQGFINISPGETQSRDPYDLCMFQLVQNIICQLKQLVTWLQYPDFPAGKENLVQMFCLIEQ